MYTKEQKKRALKEYERLGTVKATNEGLPLINGYIRTVFIFFNTYLIGTRNFFIVHI